MFFKFGKWLGISVTRIPKRNLTDITQYFKNLSKSDKEIIFDVTHPSKIAFIGLNRPKSRNALGKVLVHDFKSALLYLHDAKDLRCVVIGSLVPHIFCAGADLKERKQMPESEVENFVRDARNLFQLVSEIPIPTICAIDGPALGGGLELALACDLRYASEETQMGLVETRLAIIPGAGGTQRLPRLVGIAKAKELIFTARTVTGTEAADIGIVNASIKQNADGNAALLLAFTVAQSIAANGPVGVRMGKAAIDEGMAIVSVKEALLVEEKCYAQILPTTDRLEGLKAFVEKRKPKYEGK